MSTPEPERDNLAPPKASPAAVAARGRLGGPDSYGLLLLPSGGRSAMLASRHQTVPRIGRWAPASRLSEHVTRFGGAAPLAGGQVATESLVAESGDQGAPVVTGRRSVGALGPLGVREAPPAARPLAAERRAAGRALREAVPRSSHALWDTARRPDPIALLEASNRSRQPELALLRYERMLASPLAFLRGAPVVMAHDLATTPATGLRVQACGDAHLLNFGAYASPERNLMFDLNDFDETLPGPWEWDVKRLAASIAVASGTSGLDAATSRDAVRAAVGAYREAMARLAAMRLLDVWYSRFDAETVVAGAPGSTGRRAARMFDQARRRTSLQALPKLTGVVDGRRRIVDDPPLVTHVADERVGERLLGMFLRYRDSLPDDRRGLLERFRFVDFARKVVGVGSVGTRCYVVLLEGNGEEDPLFLQVKQAQASVLEPHVGRSAYRHHGKRVVIGQRRIQAASDIFLGWTRDGSADYYLRQLRDMKGSVALEAMRPADLLAYAGLCGRLLARAHARTGDAAAIAGYLGAGDRFDEALVTFAGAYAAQTERDHAALAAAVAAGTVATKPDP